MFQAWKYDYHRVTGNPVSGNGVSMWFVYIPVCEEASGPLLYQCGRWSLRVATSGLQCT